MVVAGRRGDRGAARHAGGPRPPARRGGAPAGRRRGRQDVAVGALAGGARWGVSVAALARLRAKPRRSSSRAPQRPLPRVPRPDRARARRGRPRAAVARGRGGRARRTGGPVGARSPRRPPARVAVALVGIAVTAWPPAHRAGRRLAARRRGRGPRARARRATSRSLLDGHPAVQVRRRAPLPARAPGRRRCCRTIARTADARATAVVVSSAIRCSTRSSEAPCGGPAEDAWLRRRRRRSDAAPRSTGSTPAPRPRDLGLPRRALRRVTPRRNARTPAPADRRSLSPRPGPGGRSGSVPWKLWLGSTRRPGRSHRGSRRGVALRRGGAENGGCTDARPSCRAGARSGLPGEAVAPLLPLPIRQHRRSSTSARSGAPGRPGSTP